ncbi:hypothetical protein COO09_09490 [Rhizorhabdus dicambivorans]|uniref:Alginate export domain-containing protein n=1 Tax=Rhizorhabdus dicambivorans TaxID=1850238 RepID=A0A2A4FW75_9SPHN|nr:hypothetical protein CMV14_06585 [Rhizorhabdus dicambivorans]PCE42689.1 hypothetical protein COO09_09490 [Rhizorhabdus dicambivorans]
MSGSIRARYEALDGQARAGFGAKDDLVSVRTTLFGEYRGDGFRVGGELYDSRAYGADAGSAIGTGEVNILELVQAYVVAQGVALPPLGGTADIQLGRFMLNLGSRRLIAADDYRNTTNGYSGARIDFRGRGGIAATAILVLPQQRRPDDIASIRDNRRAFDRENFNVKLWGGLIARPGLFGRTMGELSYFGLAERDQAGRPTRNRHLHTAGGRLIREPATGSFDYEVEGFYQFGHVRASLAAAAARLDVSAWFIHADAGYSFPGPLKARLSIEYDRASGDGRGPGFGRFDTLFGMRRADLAPAGIYAQIGRANISTPGIRLEVAPTKRLDAFVAWRAMWLAERTDAFSTSGVRDPSGRSGSFAGQQLEGRLRWWVLPARLRAEANAAWIAKGRFLRRAPNAPRTGDTHYLSLALTASF